MSFSSSVKNELARIKVEENCDIVAELAGFLPMCGSLKIKQFQAVMLYFNTENASVARRLFTFVKRYYSENVEVVVIKSQQLKQTNVYQVAVNDSNAVKVLLNDLKFTKGENVFMPNYRVNSILYGDCCKRAYIRGAFLGAGSISNPEKSYHMEFVSNSEEQSEFLSEVINSYGFNSKIVKRNLNVQ